MKLFDLAGNLLESKTDDLRQLATIAGYDPRNFYVDANFSGVDIRGQDLTGFDLSSASFAGVRANALTKLDKQYRNIALRAALATIAEDSTSSLFDVAREINPEYIALLAAVGETERAIRLVHNLLKRKNALPLYNIDIIECGLFPTKIVNDYFSRWFEEYKNNINASYNIAILNYYNLQIDLFREKTLEFISIHKKKADISNVISSLFRMKFVFSYGAQSVAADWIRKHARNQSIPEIWLAYFGGSDRSDELNRLALRWMKGSVNSADFELIFMHGADILHPREYKNLLQKRNTINPSFSSDIIDFIRTSPLGAHISRPIANNLLKILQSNIEFLVFPSINSFEENRAHWDAWSLSSVEAAKVTAEIARIVETRRRGRVD